MFDRVVECVQKPRALVGTPLEHLLRLDSPVVAEVADEQMAHLVSVSRLFDEDAADRVEVVFGRRLAQQQLLLLVGCELGVALVDDHVEHGVAHPLIGDLEDLLPLACTVELLPPLIAYLDPILERPDSRHLGASTYLWYNSHDRDKFATRILAGLAGWRNGPSTQAAAGPAWLRSGGVRCCS